MTSVYVLQHVREDRDGHEDVKFIGVYSSREMAESAISRLSRAPGFSETPDGFSIDEYRVDRDSWEEGFVTLQVEDSFLPTRTHA